MSRKTNTPSEVTDEDMMGEDEAILTKPEQPAGFIQSENIAKLESELNQTEERLAQAEDKVLRTLADMENLRRRAERDIADAHKYGIKKLLEELIPILDSLEQSLTVEEKSHDLVKNMREGMALTLQMLQKVLEKFGVKELNPINQLFNPAFHEVMMTQEKNGVAPNTIIAVLQKGYQLHDRVIRPARVIIAKAS